VLCQINAAGPEDSSVQLQFKEITDTLQYEKVEGRSMSLGNMLKSKPNRKRLFLALSLAPISMLAGSSIIT
jgi:hypothetical protein